MERKKNKKKSKNIKKSKNKLILHKKFEEIKIKHIEEAEKYRDKIGQRLFSPESVEPDKKHLIKDDIQRVNRILGIEPYGKIFLDIGCSDGSVTIEIAKKWNPSKIVGIDIAPSAIQEANEKLKTLDNDIKEKIIFEQTFIEEMKYPNEFFDTIYATETLEHIAPGMFGLAFLNILRVLKKNGKLIVSVPNRYPSRKYIEENRARWEWPTHYRYFSFSKLAKIMRRCFKEVKFLPLYDNEKPQESIYLICVCSGKKTKMPPVKFFGR